jgi:anaphase-promoting complex subunit 3
MNRFQATAADLAALKLNPFLWKSFESLCQRGEAPDPAAVFSLATVDTLSYCLGVNPILQG